MGGATSDHAHSIGIQTEEGGGSERSLSEKLRTLDELHVAQLAEGERGESEREKAEWKRECETQLKMEMERELKQFRYCVCTHCYYVSVCVCVCVCVCREHELSQARREERVRCEAELHNLRIEQEEKHQKKTESIRKLEQDTLDRLQRKEMESEAAQFARRQELQLQLQAVEAREAQLRRDSELRGQSIALAEQRISAAVEQLAVREREVEQYRQQLQTLAEERDAR